MANMYFNKKLNSFHQNLDEAKQLGIQELDLIEIDESVFIPMFEKVEREGGSIDVDSNGKLTYVPMSKEAQASEIRASREAQCFPIINRGRLWYDNLSSEQLEELNDWYQKWLEAPETLEIPAKPTWLE